MNVGMILNISEWTLLVLFITGWIISGIFTSSTMNKLNDLPNDFSFSNIFMFLLCVLFGYASIGLILAQLIVKTDVWERLMILYIRNRNNEKYESKNLIELETSKITIPDDRFVWDGKSLTYGILNTYCPASKVNEDFFFFWNGEYKNKKRMMLIYDIYEEYRNWDKKNPKSYLDKWADGEKFLNSVRVKPVCYWLH